MTSESPRTKARRYISEGRLIVDRVVPGEVRAHCRGGGAVYRLGFVDDEWFCSCPARTPRCCHVGALSLVVAMPERADGDGNSL